MVEGVLEDAGIQSHIISSVGHAQGFLPGSYPKSLANFVLPTFVFSDDRAGIQLSDFIICNVLIQII
jgi:hypothetical protein